MTKNIFFLKFHGQPKYIGLRPQKLFLCQNDQILIFFKFCGQSKNIETGKGTPILYRRTIKLVMEQKKGAHHP